MRRRRKVLVKEFTGGFGLQGTANDKNNTSEVCNYFSIKDIWNV
jgi:hypothetical protein